MNSKNKKNLDVSAEQAAAAELVRMAKEQGLSFDWSRREMVLSLYLKGLTTGEISARFDDIYGARVSKETVSRITDKVIEEMTHWVNRPSPGLYGDLHRRDRGEDP